MMLGIPNTFMLDCAPADNNGIVQQAFSNLRVLVPGLSLLWSFLSHFPKFGGRRSGTQCRGVSRGNISSESIAQYG